jgi:hypothetical protein
MQFSGRLEARIDVPTGGAAASATIPNGAGATAVTVPAGSYFMSDDGALDGLLSTFQTKLNETVQGYPITAAATAAAIGHGTWDAGWLFNIASGNDSGVFGGVTMTAVGSPTYGTAGPRGGVDLAVGFDSATDAFSAGDVFDATAADDLAFACVVKFTAATANFANFITKGNGAPDGRVALYTMADGRLIVETKLAGVTQANTEIVLPAYDTWMVLLFVIERATAKMRIGARTLAGTSVMSAEIAHPAVNLSSPDALLIGRDNVADPTTAKVAAFYVAHGAGAATGLSANLSTALTNFANAVNAAWSVSLSSTTGLVSIGWTGYSTPTWSLTWTSTNLRDALGFTANIAGVTATQTGTQQARGVWYPDAPLLVRDSDPRLAPVGSDARTSVTPTGEAITLVGNYFREHKGLMWQLIPVDRIREQSATYANASWRTFWDDTQLGRGHSWFVPGAPLLIVDHTGQVLGSDMASTGPTNGWQVVDPSRVEPRRHDPGGWNGLWNLEIAQVIAEDE